MPVEPIEDLKQNYTDKYVVVDASRPELARFRDQVGQVKTVNMNGRALVQFADYHLNIGWYDIGLNYLKVVNKPDVAAKQPAEKKQVAPAKKPASAAEKPAAQAKGAAPAGKPSVADILAAARGGGAAKPATPPAAKAAPKAAAPPAKVDPKKMSTADILAMARGNTAAAPAAPAAKAPAAEPAAPEPVAEEAQPAPAPAAKAPTGNFDKSSMSIDQMVAWCREHDAE